MPAIQSARRKRSSRSASCDGSAPNARRRRPAARDVARDDRVRGGVMPRPPQPTATARNDGDVEHPSRLHPSGAAVTRGGARDAPDEQGDESGQREREQEDVAARPGPGAQRRDLEIGEAAWHPAHRECRAASQGRRRRDATPPYALARRARGTRTRAGGARWAADCRMGAGSAGRSDILPRARRTRDCRPTTQRKQPRCIQART